MSHVNTSNGNKIYSMIALITACNGCVLPCYTTEYKTISDCEASESAGSVDSTNNLTCCVKAFYRLLIEKGCFIEAEFTATVKEMLTVYLDGENSPTKYTAGFYLFSTSSMIRPDYVATRQENGAKNDSIFTIFLSFLVE